MAAGDTNLTNLVLSGDCTVGDDLTVTDDVTVGGTLAVTGAATFASTVTSLVNLDTTSISDGAHTVVAADVGKVFLGTKADGATTLTLPAPAAANSGWAVQIIQTVDQNLVITGTADKMVVFGGDGTSQTCTFSTSSEKLGAAALCISNGTVWIVVPLVGTATIA